MYCFINFHECPQLLKCILEQWQKLLNEINHFQTDFVIGETPIFYPTKQLYRLAGPIQSKKGILRSIHTTMANGTPIKVIFIQDRNKKSSHPQYRLHSFRTGIVRALGYRLSPHKKGPYHPC